jgi:hypothetical protein
MPLAQRPHGTGGKQTSKVPDFAKDPKWAIVPRTDNNTLPPQSTTMP